MFVEKKFKLRVTQEWVEIKEIWEKTKGTEENHRKIQWWGQNRRKLKQ